MTGVYIVGALLTASPELLAVVPAVRIKAGTLPDGVQLPALLVREVSSVERQPLRRKTPVRTTDRVAVTVRANSYREQVAVMQLVKNACAGRTGNVGGALSVSILTAGRGPDVIGPAASFEQTQDFRVSFDAPSTSAAPTVTGTSGIGGSGSSGAGGVTVANDFSFASLPQLP